MPVTIGPATVDVDDLADALGLDEADARVTRAFGSAKATVDDILVDAWRDVPTDIVDQLYLEVGQATYARLEAPAGGSQYARPDVAGGPVVRAPRDAVNQSWPTIRRYVMPL